MNSLKPAFRFLLLFVGVYIIGNLAYGFWTQSFSPLADPATRLVTEQVRFILNMVGEGVETSLNVDRPTISIINSEDNVVINVYEGCNGINVMIVFVSFFIAFQSGGKKWVWFIPMGLLLIHLANLVRVSALYAVAQYYQNYFYYIHKYFFTASIYLLVLMLWWFWIEKVNRFALSSTFPKSHED